MTDHPILFNGEMVRAILAGRKTMTRRVVKPHPSFGPHCAVDRSSEDASWLYYKRRTSVDVECYWRDGNAPTIPLEVCPYGQPGARLWVRETWTLADGFDPEPDLYFAADHPHPEDLKQLSPWRPSIHMPRKYSRITLEVTGVRVERLQEITCFDALNEGIDSIRCCDGSECGCQGLPVLDEVLPDFEKLWDSINAKRGYGWETNPWVWVVEFRRVEG